MVGMEMMEPAQAVAAEWVSNHLSTGLQHTALVEAEAGSITAGHTALEEMEAEAEAAVSERLSMVMLARPTQAAAGAVAASMGQQTEMVATAAPAS